MFPSRPDYEKLIYNIVQTYPEVKDSSLHFFTTSATAGLLKGSLIFKNGYVLQVTEVIDFGAGEILDYSYTLSKDGERICWHDPQPHPNDPILAITFPHHVHEQPNIKQNRKPAQGISFNEPNLPILIKQISSLN
jgi:hypothetical protein